MTTKITDEAIAAARERGIEPPIDPLHALAYELEGVIMDAERSGFDAVCLDTVKRVRDALYAYGEANKHFGSDFNDFLKEEGIYEEVTATALARVSEWQAKMESGNVELCIDHHTYSVTWSAEDSEYVGLCTEFPSLSWLAKTPEEAIAGIRRVVAESVADMAEEGASVIEKETMRQYAELSIEGGSGNIYADLGMPVADTMLAKAQCARAIAEDISARKLARAQAAEVIGIDPDQLAGILRGQFRDVEQDDLLSYLAKLHEHQGKP